jgi:hypothetical protein
MRWKRTETTVLESTRVLPTVRAFSTVSVEIGFSMKSCEGERQVSSGSWSKKPESIEPCSEEQNSQQEYR